MVDSPAAAAQAGTSPTLKISPVPSDEEAAAITAALIMAWPRPAAVEASEAGSNRWRFSGRWWTKPTWGR